MSKRSLGPPPDWINPEDGDAGPSRDPLRSIFTEARATRTREGDRAGETPPSPMAAVCRLADERATEIRESLVCDDIKRRLRDEQKQRGEFAAVYSAPSFTSDVPDVREARLVILGPSYPHQTEADESAACRAATNYLEHRGAGPRRYRNTLVFLAADATGLRELQAAVRRYLAWRNIVEEAHALQLDPSQTAGARSLRDESDQAVQRQIPDAFSWLLIPAQAEPEEPLEWHEMRAQGAGSLAVRASTRLISEGLLHIELTGSHLRDELDKITQWAGGHVGVTQLTEYFAQYLYLPRLRDSRVLQDAIRDGLASRPGDASAGTSPFAPGPKRFRASITVDGLHFGRDAARIRTDVLQHLNAVPGARARVTLQIEADFREGASEALTRTVIDHCKALRFAECAFEEE